MKVPRRWSGCGSRLWSRNARPGLRGGCGKSTPVEKRATGAGFGVWKSTLVENVRRGAGFGVWKSTPVEKCAVAGLVEGCGCGSRLRSRNVRCGAGSGCGVRKSTPVEKRASRGWFGWGVGSGRERRVRGCVADAEVDSGQEMCVLGGCGDAGVDSGRETYVAERVWGAAVDSGRETCDRGGVWGCGSRLRSGSVRPGLGSLGGSPNRRPYDIDQDEDQQRSVEQREEHSEGQAGRRDDQDRDPARSRRVPAGWEAKRRSGFRVGRRCHLIR